MSQAEELLNSLSESMAEHTHPVTDTDTYFIIDPMTREIENTNRKKTVVMQYDHNSERFTFQLPRYIDGHDMMKCNSVVVNVDNIEEVTGTTNSDAPSMTDLRVNPDDPETVISSWLISRNSTQLAGNLSFSIEYKCVADDGTVVYEFGTDSYDDIEVRARKKNGEAALAEYSDVLEQWRTDIFGAGDSVMNNITAEGEAQVAAVKAESETQQTAVEVKGAQTLDTIPDEYTEVYNMAEEALRKKANAIVREADGESIVVNDSSDSPLLGLKLIGRTVQATTTGAQLADLPDGEISSAGVTWTCINGVVTAKGTTSGTSSTNASIRYDMTGLIGTFTVSGNGNKVEVYVSITKNETTSWYMNKAFKLDGTETSVIMYCQVYGDGVVVNETVYPMLNAGDKALPWEPYTGGKPSPNPEYPQELVSVENPKISVYGKNLINFWAIQKSANTSLEISDDGYVITIVGGSTYPYTSSHVVLNVDEYRGRAIIFKLDSISSTIAAGRGCAQLAVKTSEKTTYLALNEETPKFDVTIPDDVVSITLGLYSNNTNTVLETDNTVVIKGLMFALVDGDWEPYKPIQSMSIAHAIHGIPVTSGGNYIDENGKQWICDEIDFERGVYVKKIVKKTFSASVNEAWRVYNVQSEKTHTAYQESKLCGDMKVFTGTSADIGEILSNKYAAIPLTDVYDNGAQGISVSNVSPAIRMCVDTCQGYSIEEFREWLKANPFELIYPLATPIETPLTETEIAYYKKLKTNYHTTTVLNDQNAYMTIKYNADTLIYLRDHQPKPTDEQVQAAINEYANKHGLQIPSDNHINTLITTAIEEVANGTY
jgi:hypothetical protein